MNPPNQIQWIDWIAPYESSEFTESKSTKATASIQLQAEIQNERFV